MLHEFRDALRLKGRVEVFASRGKPALILGEEIRRVGIPDHILARLPKIYKSCDIKFSDGQLIDTQDLQNILVDDGKDRVIQSLTSGRTNVIARMCVGDRGTIPSDRTVPKVPTADMTALFNEVYRDDCEAVVLNVGTPGVHEVKFIKTFSAVTIPLTAFSNQSDPVVNEVAVVMIDAISGEPLPRVPFVGPITSVNQPLADESIFAIRTFKSVPFEAANEIAVTIRYTIYIE